MNGDAAKKLLDELIPAFEALEARCGAMWQLLQDKKIASEKRLAAYMEKAGAASDVRWRAARLRIEHLLSSADSEGETHVEDVIAKPPKESAEAEAAQPSTQAETANGAHGSETPEAQGYSTQGDENQKPGAYTEKASSPEAQVETTTEKAPVEAQKPEPEKPAEAA